MSKNKEDIDEEHRKILSEVLSDRKDMPSPKKAMFPLIILAVIIIFSLVTWVIPHYHLEPSAKVRNVPSVKEIAVEYSFSDRPDSNLISDFVIMSPDIKASAAFIASSTCRNVDKRCYAQAVYYFVRDNINYVSDPLDEYYELPSETIIARAADCDGHAILLASLLSSVGIEYRFAYSPNHVWVQARVPKNDLFSRDYSYEWIDLDATCKTCRPGKLRPDS